MLPIRSARLLKRVTLVGAGHAHVGVLRAFAAHAEDDVALTLVTPTTTATYTGMVPGVVAGQYALSDAQIDVANLARRAGARVVHDRVAGVDAERRRLLLEGSDPIEYDVVSFNIGAHPRAGNFSADAPVVWVKPIERAVIQLEQLLAVPASRAGRRIVIVGAGAGGVELSFALQARLRSEMGAQVTLCDRKQTVVPERGARAVRLVTAALAAQGITFRGGVVAERVDREGVHCADGRLLPADIVVWSTGAAAPPLFAAAQLPVDEQGFLCVDATLRCVSRPDVLGAGDAIALRDTHQLPKAGVFAVRQGPVLAANLRLIARGVARLQFYQPQRLFLSLLNTCDGRAILSYGRVALHTRWAWHLKDRIDRRFVAQCNDRRRMSAT